MRTANIKTLEQANEFLISYLPKFNARFDIQRKNIKSVFESQPSDEIINLTLAIVSSRKFDHGSSIKYHNKYYQAINSTESEIINFRNGTECLVIQTLDKKLFVDVEEKVYVLREILERKMVSSEFDEKPIKIESKKAYVPPMTHPWKKASYDQFIAKQKHRQECSQNGANV